jgi:hypothetical protein
MSRRADWDALRARRLAEPGAQDAYEAARAARLAFELGRSARQLREEQGWSQTELARLAGRPGQRWPGSRSAVRYRRCRCWSDWLGHSVSSWR